MACSTIGRGHDLCRFILCALLLCKLMHHGTAVQTAGMLGINATQKPSPSILSLFNLKTSKFWNDDVMTYVADDYNLPEKVSLSKDAVRNYTQAGNVARYLGFRTVDTIHIPIPVNFIFIGFNGEGNHQLKLGGDELERWFRDIDHILEHTRIPQLGESLSPFYRVSGAGEQRHHLPLVSNVHYNYSVHAVHLGASATKVIEQAISVLARKEDPADKIPDIEGTWQVDMDSMEHILSSLVAYLDLNDAYNVFIVNPKRDLSRGKYGYRRGLSTSEVGMLVQDAKLKEDVQKNLLKRHDLFEEVDKTLRRPLYTRHPLLRFAFTAADNLETAEWADAYVRALESHSQFLKGKSDSEITAFQAQQTLLQQNFDLSLPLKKYLSEEGANFKSDCLTDTWVSKDRWAFIDLTAGSFTWGPTVGGEGVRLSNSLPSVERSFDQITWNGNVESDEELQRDVQKMVDDRFTSFGEDDAPVIDMLMAELDVYEMFATHHCSGRKIRVALCEELQEKIADLREELESYHSDEHNEEEKQKATDVLKRIDGWKLFGDIHEHAQEFSVAKDRFLSHLGATLSTAMKHVLTTSTADGAFHYYDKIYFRIYVIAEEKLKGRKSAVNEAAIKEALSTLILPNQKVEYSIQRIALFEDPALAMAFSVSKRAAVVPVLALNGTERPQQRTYLDSVILQHQLQHISLSEKRLHGRPVLEVPIFWWVQFGEPLFIDKHYLAKALPDMVIVVQTNNSAWESHLQCNNRSIIWDLSRPWGAAIAATAEHLGGLMPAHITYSHAHENAIQDWTWATGCHPFSSTADGSQLSHLHRDALARSYIITALDESIQTVNEAIEILVKELTHDATLATFQTLREHEYRLLHPYHNVVNVWKQIVRVGEKLRFEDAMRLLGTLEDSSNRFLASAEATMEALHPIHCTRQRKIEKGANTFAGLAISAVVLMLWWFLRPRRKKPKLN